MSEDMIIIERKWKKEERGMLYPQVERKAFRDDDVAGVNKYLENHFGEYKFTRV